MFFRPTMWAALGFVVSSSLAASAEVVISTANNPTVQVSDTVHDVLGSERAGIAALSKGRVNRLSREPKAVTGDHSAKIYDAGYLATLPASKGGEAWACLAEALYFEARGEVVMGIFAVGEVIMNRVSHPSYPDDVCGVIYQGSGKKFQCQFTYSCDGIREVISEPRAYDKVGRIARLILEGDAPLDLTDGATHYHTKSVRPRWSRVFPRTATIGVHHFYRKDAQLASN